MRRWERVGEIALLVKYLPQKQKDLPLILRTQVKMLGMGVQICNPMTSAMDPEGSQGLTGQLV